MRAGRGGGDVARDVAVSYFIGRDTRRLDPAGTGGSLWPAPLRNRFGAGTTFAMQRRTRERISLPSDDLKRCHRPRTLIPWTRRGGPCASVAGCELEQVEDRHGGAGEGESHHD